MLAPEPDHADELCGGFGGRSFSRCRRFSTSAIAPPRRYDSMASPPAFRAVAALRVAIHRASFWPGSRFPGFRYRSARGNGAEGCNDLLITLHADRPLMLHVDLSPSVPNRNPALARSSPLAN